MNRIAHACRLVFVVGTMLATSAVVSPGQLAQASSSRAQTIMYGDPGPAAVTAAATALMTYHGGRVVLNPAVHLVFWGWHGNDPAAAGPYFQAFLNGVGGTPWLNIVTQYCQGVATGSTSCKGAGQPAGNPPSILKDVWADDVDPSPASPTDANVKTEAAAAAQHFGLNPASHNSDIIMVIEPHGAGFPHSGACGYHDQVTSGSFAGLAYSDEVYPTDKGAGCGVGAVNGSSGTLDGASATSGHELAEAITDPGAGSGWQNGAEIGDPCAWLRSGTGAMRNLTLSTGTFAVQSLWSNASGGCAMSYGTVVPPPPTPTPQPGPAGPPTSLTGTASGTGTLVMSWLPPAPTGSPVSEYAIYLYGADGSASMHTSTSTSLTVTGLSSNTYYTFTITDWNSHGWSGWSNWATWTLVL